ncbi:MAG: ATP-binding protein [Myxococcota bacterium]|nr:ATP-binding protein [Myxococcota bacterium]
MTRTSTAASETLGGFRLGKAQKATRLLCVLAIVAFSSFGLVDPFVYEGSLLPLYTVRGVAIAVSILLYWLTGRPGMNVRAYWTGAAISLLTGVVVVILTDLTGGTSSVYWTMLMLTFFTASLIMPFRPWQAAAVYFSLAGFYDVWMLARGAVTDSSSWVVSNAGIWLSVFISVLAVIFINDLRDREDADRARLRTLNDKLRTEIAEREKAEKGLRRTQQLDAAGRLAAGLAHELNNVLLVISGSAELIQRRSTTPDKLTDRILESAQRGARLTADMLLFARKGHRADQPFCVNSLVKSIAEAIGETQAAVTRVELELEEPGPWVAGDQQQISQALLNLCLNGVDAMETYGVLTLRTASRDARVVLTVTDSGQGMTAAEQERAFEPFFTTKPPGKGTGLGLSMVYGIVNDHGGTIELESVPGTGTTVTLTLPRTSALPQVDAGEPPVVPTRFDEARLLLIDDDARVRTVMAEALSSSGLHVVQAASGKEGIDHMVDASAPFGLVILDMVMPVMDGEETFQAIRALEPALPVLLYSGHTPENKLATLLREPNTRFLPKPFQHHQLLEAVGQLLHARSRGPCGGDST